MSMDEASGDFFGDSDAGSGKDLELGEQLYNAPLNATRLPCYSGWFGVCHECDEQGSCLCGSGFNGHSDFVPMDRSRWGDITLTCPNYEPVLIAMYAIAFVLSVEAIWRTWTSLRFQMEIVRLKQRSNKERISTWTVLSFLACLTLNLLFALLKLICPEQITGIDLAPTLLHVWRANVVYCADHLHRLRIFMIAIRAQTASIGRQRVSEKKKRQARRASREAIVVTVITHILVTPAALATAGLLASLRLQTILYLTYVCINLFRNFFAFTAAMFTSRSLSRSLTGSMRAAQASRMVALGGASAAAERTDPVPVNAWIIARSSAPPRLREMHEELHLLQHSISATSAGDRAMHVPNLLAATLFIAFATPPLMTKNSYLLAFVSMLYNIAIRQTVLLYSRKAYLDEHVVQHV